MKVRTVSTSCYLTSTHVLWYTHVQTHIHTHREREGGTEGGTERGKQTGGHNFKNQVQMKYVCRKLWYFSSSLALLHDTALDVPLGGNVGQWVECSSRLHEALGSVLRTI